MTEIGNIIHNMAYTSTCRRNCWSKKTQAIYRILGKELKQSAQMSGNYEIQEDLSKDVRSNFNHWHEDPSNNENIIKSVQNYAGKNSEEKSDQEKQEITRDKSEDRSDEAKHSQTNEVVVSQDLQCDGEKHGVSKDKLQFLRNHRII